MGEFDHCAEACANNDGFRDGSGYCALAGQIVEAYAPQPTIVECERSAIAEIGLTTIGSEQLDYLLTTAREKLGILIQETSDPCSLLNERNQSYQQSLTSIESLSELSRQRLLRCANACLRTRFGDMVTEAKDNDASDQSLYPEITFDLSGMPDIDAELEPEDALSLIVNFSLSLLNRIAMKKTEDDGADESAPDNVLPMRTYSRNDLTEERHQRFLSETVGARYGTKARRKITIVHQDRAAQQVVEDLAITLHPVFQLIKSLRDTYGSNIKDVSTSSVVIEIIKHTNYSKFRRALSQQVTEWSPEPDTSKPLRTGMKGRPKPVFTVIVGENQDDTKGNGHKKKIKGNGKNAKPPEKTSSKNGNGHGENGRTLAIKENGVIKTPRQPREGHRRYPRR